MTDAALGELPLAVYRRRPEGHLTVEIEGGQPPIPAAEGSDGHPGLPPLVARFRVPGPEDGAAIEAKAREAILNLVQGRGAELRYGLAPAVALDETTIAALSPFLTAVESAAHLIVDWNLAYADDAGEVTKAPVNVETIAELFRGRPAARSGWMLQFETVSPLERAEGNVFAASPDTTSATAATTAGDASSGAAPAPVADAGVPDATAPAL